VAEPLRTEITPKNILMIGPTGVGKTEIARRLARLANAPFIKVEATKFTEVGYVGRDVDTIIRDLMEIASRICASGDEVISARAEDAAEDRILDALLPPARPVGFGVDPQPADESGTRQKFRKKLREGELERPRDRHRGGRCARSRKYFAPPGMEELTSQLQSMFQNMGNQRRRSRKMRIDEALRVLTDEEAARLVNEEEVKQQALLAVEQHGIVFLDEIDKIATRSGQHGADVSRQGVQRDLLPLVEGTTITDQVRHGQDRPHPVHRQRRVPPVQARVT
jgi:ATP-dependent HslUV protease ATP-binding subunit HslU